MEELKAPGHLIRRSGTKASIYIYLAATEIVEDEKIQVATFLHVAGVT